MKRAIIAVVEFFTDGRIRGQHFSIHDKKCFGFQPSLRWWYTGTKRFRHSGWVYLSRRWFRDNGHI